MSAARVGVASATVDAEAGRPDIVWLDNGCLRLGFVPHLGARLLSVQVDGVETIWRNPNLLDDDLHPVGDHTPGPVRGNLGDWNNYGGDKTWPAPQGWDGPGQWAGPPDPVLDSGAWAWSVWEFEGGVQLTMLSPDDPRTGLRLERRFTLTDASAQYLLDITAVNVSDRSVTWSIWNVMQRRSGVVGEGGVDVGVGLLPTAEPDIADVVAVLAGTGIPETWARRGDRVRVPHQLVVGKVGFPSASGWLAHIADGTTCTMSFEVDPARSYPDGGSRVEVWLEHPQRQPLRQLGDLDPPDHIVEIEVLGPLTTLEPGESSALSIRCSVVRETANEVLEVRADGHRTDQGWRSYLRDGQ